MLDATVRICTELLLGCSDRLPRLLHTCTAAGIRMRSMAAGVTVCSSRQNRPSGLEHWVQSENKPGTAKKNEQIFYMAQAVVV